MFPTNNQEPTTTEKKDDESKIMYKYKNILTQPSFEETATNSMNKIDEMLETEKKSMNSEPWITTRQPELSTTLVGSRSI